MSDKDYDAVLASILEENPDFDFRQEVVRLQVCIEVLTDITNGRRGALEFVSAEMANLGTRIQALTDILNGHIDIQDEEE